MVDGRFAIYPHLTHPMKHTYRLEVRTGNSWYRLFENSRDFCMGYLTRAMESSPRLAMRVMRGDGVLVDQIAMSDSVSIGMVAGWPTAEQYRQAAHRALAAAEEIERRPPNARLHS